MVTHETIDKVYYRVQWLRFRDSVLWIILLACAWFYEGPRPTKTEINQADYRQCVRDFTPCKGKFIKFDGVVQSMDENYVRIKNEAHGFDVFGLSNVEKAIVGSKVIFSGYLNEHHLFNDDVVRGRIETILTNCASTISPSASPTPSVC
jgi:hypothetical protein